MTVTTMTPVKKVGRAIAAITPGTYLLQGDKDVG